MKYIFRILIIKLIFSICVFAGEPADYLTVKESVNLNINEDKSFSRKVMFEEKILSYKGKKDLSEYKIFYDSRYEKVTIVNAYTKKADGRIIETEKDMRKELDSPYESGMMEFAVTKMILVPFLGVEVGDIVHLEFIKENKSGRDIFDSYVFSGTEKALEKIYTVEYPKDLDLKISESNFGKEIEKKGEKTGDRIKVTYRDEDISSYRPEENMPLPENIFPALYISTYGGVKKFGKAIYTKYFENLDMNNPVLNKLSDELLSGADDDLEKIKRLKKYFSEEFMYIPQNDFFKFEPRDFSKVIESGYGTPVEAYIIFNSMLRKLGIKNSIMIIGDEGYNLKGDIKNGNIAPFFYMISRIKLRGKVYYVDILNEFYKLDESEFDKKTGIVLGRRSYFEEVRSRKKNERAVVYKIKIDENGSAFVEKQNRYSGEMASRIRTRYKYITEYDLKKDYEKLMSSISIFAKPASEMKIELGEKPSISYEYVQDNYASKDGEFIYFDLVASLTPYILEIEPNERKFSFENDEDLILSRKYRIKIPQGYEIILAPESLKYSDKLFDVERKVEFEGDTLYVEEALTYKNGILEGEFYEHTYRSSLELSHPKNTRVLLRKIVEK